MRHSLAEPAHFDTGDLLPVRELNEELRGVFFCDCDALRVLDATNNRGVDLVGWCLEEHDCGVVTRTVRLGLGHLLDFPYHSTPQQDPLRVRSRRNEYAGNAEQCDEPARACLHRFVSEVSFLRTCAG